MPPERESQEQQNGVGAMSAERRKLTLKIHNIIHV